jgi:HEAT repeat protein
MKVQRHLLLALFPLIIGLGWAQEKDPAGEAYQKAYNLILDEKWTEAIPALERVIGGYPESDWADDARFWQCYAHEKSDKKLESAFECYQEFLDDYPDSKWANDAKSNLIRIGEQLNRSGKGEYGAKIKAMKNEDDEEIAMSALMALQQMGDEKSLPVVIRLYDKTKSQAVRERILFLFSQSESPEAERKLAAIAKSDGNKDNREKAVFWLGQRAVSRESLEVLKSIALTDTNEDVRDKAIYSLTQIPDGKGMPAVMEIARKHRDPEMREKAVFWIGEMKDSPEALDVLKEILKQDQDQDVRDKTLYAVTKLSGNAGVPVLIETAKNDPNPELRRKAIFWLGQTKDERAKEALLEIIEGESP